MRKVIGLMLILFLALASPAFSQQRWERTYGGAGEDYGYSVKQTQDGGYIIAGSSNSFGNNAQVYLIKTNTTGDTLWTRTYGGTNDDGGFAVQQTQEGGYIVSGATFSYGNSEQVYLIKTNASGDTLWTRTYGGAGFDNGWAAQQTTDGGYIVAGTSNSFGTDYQVYLIKTNATGDTLWTRTYGGTNNDFGYSVQQTSDGGYIVTGESHSFGNYDQVYLVKTNASGDTLWTRTYGGGDDDYGFSVQQTSDGGYIVAGITGSYGFNYDVYLVKTNATGDTLWTRNYGGADVDRGNSVQQTSDGGYIVTGWSSSFGNGNQVFLVKTNISGDTLWTRTYGGTNWDEAKSVQQTSDGGYIVAGFTRSFGNNWQVYLIKTDEYGSSGIESNKGFEGPRVQGFKATPNPFISFATIPGHEAERFSLYDVSGRKVGTYKGDRIGEGLGPGVYFVSQEGRRQKAEGGLTRIVKIR